MVFPCPDFFDDFDETGGNLADCSPMEGGRKREAIAVEALFAEWGGMWVRVRV